MRLGIFGGSFDPVHYGHLLLAENCREQVHLDEVWFMPAAAPPHKRTEVLSSAAQRIEMLELATGGHPAFRVSHMEVERGGVSYTVDTLATIAEADPNREIFLLLGADSLADLPNWREPARICELATPIVVEREREPPVDFNVLAGIVSASRLAEIPRCSVVMPPIGLSSTEIRCRVAQGMSIRYRTPRAVETYIESHGLYRNPV